MSTFDLQIDETIDTDTDATQTLYRLRFEVLNAVGIEPALFVARVTDDAVRYVAKVRDLRVYPTDKAVAVANGQGFYRVNIYELYYTSLREAQEARDVIKATLKSTNCQWSEGIPGQSFGGRTLFTYDSTT